MIDMKQLANVKQGVVTQVDYPGRKSSLDYLYALLVEDVCGGGRRWLLFAHNEIYYRDIVEIEGITDKMVFGKLYKEGTCPLPNVQNYAIRLQLNGKTMVLVIVDYIYKRALKRAVENGMEVSNG